MTRAVAMLAPREAAFDVDAFTNINQLRIIKENLGGEPLTSSDFPKINFPSSGSKFFDLPTATGEPNPSTAIVGIILERKMVRAYWLGEYSGENVPPQCSSNDNKTGVGDPGGNCAICPMAQWGSSEKGNNGQACKQVNVNFMRIVDSQLPVVLNIPPTSLKAMKDFMIALANGGHQFSNCVVSLELEETKNKGGIRYSRIKPRLLQVLTDDEARKVGLYKAQFNEIFASVQMNADDFAPEEKAD